VSARGGVRRLALRGPDLVLLAGHPRWPATGRSHNTLLVVECDGPVAPARITRALDRFLDACPWPAARLRRPLPWGKLHWAAGRRDTLTRPALRRLTIKSREHLERELTAELNTPIEPRREAPLRVLVLDGGPEPAASSFVVMTWFHPLMDARGGEIFLTHLAHLDRHDGEDGWPGTPPAFVPEPESRSLIERGRIAGGSLKYLRTLAPEPPVSPGGLLATLGPTRFTRTSFAAPSSAEDPRMTREITWRLAVVGRAMADLWRARRLPDVPFLVPLSVDLRPKGEAGAIFGSQLAFHFARFRPSETDDVPALARVLRRQMADAVRDGHIDANAVAMQFLQYRPLSTVLRVLPWTAGGELFSFHCADLADWPRGLEDCFGRHVVNAYHVPVVPPRPGIGVFFNRCGRYNNLVVSWLEGVVSDAEAARIVETIREEMGWGPPV
jgi:hypothetical protein